MSNVQYLLKKKTMAKTPLLIHPYRHWQGGDRCESESDSVSMTSTYLSTQYPILRIAATNFC